MIVMIDGTTFTVAFREENGRHVAEWTCGACQATGRAAAALVETALNGAKAGLLIHHTMEHGLTFIGYV